MAKIEIQTKAPNFRLKNQFDKTISLKDVEGEFTVLFFYPKDNTPGCKIEAQGFSSLSKEYKKNKVALFGISGGDLSSKVRFCKNAQLEVPLLIDTDGAVGKKYEAYGEKSFMGKKYFGFSRKTFVLDSSKTIIKIYDKVKPPGHAEEVLEYIKSIA